MEVAPSSVEQFEAKIDDLIREASSAETQFTESGLEDFKSVMNSYRAKVIANYEEMDKEELANVLTTVQTKLGDVAKNAEQAMEDIKSTVETSMASNKSDWDCLKLEIVLVGCFKCLEMRLIEMSCVGLSNFF